MKAQTVAAILPRRTPRLIVTIAMTVLLSAASFQSAWAQVVPPTLNTAQAVAVFAGATITSTGPTVITGDVDLQPGTAITGGPTIIGTTNINNGVSNQALLDSVAVYGDLAGRTPFTTVSTDLGGLSLVSGVYRLGAATLKGTLTLNGSGNPNAVWIFQIASTLITTADSIQHSSVQVTNGGQPCNVFWQVGSSATIEVGTSFEGSIFALTDITLKTGAALAGRAIAGMAKDGSGAVTMDSNTIGVTTCAPTSPTVAKAFVPPVINSGNNSTLTITLGNPSITDATSATLTDTLPSGVTTVSLTSNSCGGSVVLLASSVALTGGTIPANGTCTIVVLVTSSSPGDHLNSIPSGALSTSHGLNVLLAAATLTVNPVNPTEPVPNTVGKVFIPASITAGVGNFSILTITVSNPNNSIQPLGGPFTDTLISGVTVFNPSVITNPCGLSVTAIAGASTVTLNSGNIPANGFCSVGVKVTAPVAGSYPNLLVQSAATLTVVRFCPVTPPSISWVHNLSGPPRVAVLLATAAEGIQTIKVIASTNLLNVQYSVATEGGTKNLLPALNVPFTVPGNPTVVYIFAEKLNPNLGSVIGVKVTDVCANAMTFDPFDVTVFPGNPVTVTAVEAAETLVQIVNHKLGALSITVNGQQRVIQMRRDETRLVDIGRWMTVPDSKDEDGNPVGHNTITLEARGRKGSSAEVTVYPPPTGNKPSRR